MDYAAGLIMLYLLTFVRCKRLTEEENRKLKMTCGRSANGDEYEFKVLGGINVTRDEYPFIATLHYYTGKNFQLCGGSLISSYHVITAAHCVMRRKGDNKDCYKPVKEKNFEYDYNFDVNSWNVFFGSACRFVHECASTHTISEVYIHSDYDGCREFDDLAIIVLADPVPADEGYPICLPNENETLPPRMIATGSGGDLTVANSSPTLLRLDVSVFRDETNVNAAKESKFVGLQKTFFSRVKEKSKMLETTGLRTAMCAGDSGGPLFFIRGEPYVQIGVTAAVMPPCEKKSKYVRNRYVDLRSYLPWICTVTGVCAIEQTTN